MHLLTVILQNAQVISSEIKNTSGEIIDMIKIIYWMAGILVLLIGYIWKYSVSRNDKTEEKVDKLTETMIELATMMKVIVPQTKENSDAINAQKVTCAENNHTQKKR